MISPPSLLVTSYFANKLVLGVFSFALPWLVLENGGSAALAGLLLSLKFLPGLVANLPAGITADRYNTRNILLICNGMQMIVCALGAYYLTHYQAGTIGVVTGLVMVLGFVASYNLAASYSLASSITEPGRLPRLHACINSLGQVGTFGGPAIGGILYGMGGEALLLWPLVLLLAISIITALGISSQKVVSSLSSADEGIWNVLSGLWATPQLRVLTLAGMSWNLFAACGMVYLVPLLATEFDFSASTTGAALAGGMLGSFLAGFVIIRALHRFDTVQIATAALAIEAIMMSALVFMNTPALFFSTYALTMVANTSIASSFISARSAQFTHHRQGIAISSGAATHLVAFMLGGVLGGWLLHLVGFIGLFVVAGAGLMCTAIALWYYFAVKFKQEKTSPE